MLPPAPSLLGLLLLLLLCPAHVGGLWWAVGSPLVMDPTSICRKARRLAGRQAELCQAEPEVVAELARGARLGVRECQFQFRFRRWNCSSHSKAFGRILQQGQCGLSTQGAAFSSLGDQRGVCVGRLPEPPSVPGACGHPALTLSPSQAALPTACSTARHCAPSTARHCAPSTPLHPGGGPALEAWVLPADCPLPAPADIRETAFVFAITAAGASHAVTQACSMGELLQCGCQAPRGRAPPRPPGLPGTPGPPGPAAGSTDGSATWEWGGCGDDVDFGDEKSRLFMDARHKRGRGDIRALVQLHNNEAGRLAVRSHTRTECKCHGLSGSCALRTCWQKLPPFREVGARLLERFHGASRVMGTNDGKALLPAVRTLKPPGRADLLYAADSPDFCAPNRRTGSPGTRGRACNSSAPDLSGCDLLCCGRGHRQESVQLEENCLCRFHWCCVVQCHRCRVRKELSLCL
uniref:Protein Wnt n=1 Tax=Canis lupus familiaris TaxID=9615 RepID=A0A8P0PFT7_CANLF